MRLICPNCGAQYEVPTEVIPENGRDVQCSDCGTTWYQHHPDHPPEEDQDTPQPAADTPQAEPAWQADGDGEAEHTQLDDAEYGTDDDETDDAALERESPSPEPAPEEETQQRRGLDPSVADVLREEAEREHRAREQEKRGTVETQQDLGLPEAESDAQRRSEEARNRMARLRGESQPGQKDDTLSDIDPSSRSNLLPDIDEINSSLDSDRPREDTAPSAASADASIKAKRGGFRSGFRLAVVLAVVALMIYVFAPQIAETVPQLTTPLAAYVDTINGWRSGLDSLLEALATSLSEEPETTDSDG